MRTQYKVYIIDEVHMLTKEAFNALLKTLEEPPPNVKFVFCTTEPEKVPDTILSRCQRFDFSTIEDASISQRLREIAQVEGFDVEDEAIELVARRARGSMRDSQSLFDQLLAFSEGTVSGADVHRMLGTASDDLLMRLFGHIVEHRPGDVLNVIEEALSAGVRAGELLDQSVGYLRDLMVLLSDGATVRLTSVGDSNRETVLGQARQMELPNLLAAFQVLSEAKNQIFRSTFDRVLLEMAMVQVALLENLTAISSLLSGNLPTLPSDDESAAKTDQKKTADLTPASLQAATDQPNPRHLLDFRTGNEEALFAQLITQSSLALTSAIRKLDRIAISEPNQLELVLSAAYDFAKHVLEDPEHQSAVQRIVVDATGIRPVVRLQILAADEEEVRVGARSDEALPSVGTAVRPTDRVQENRNGRATVSGRPASGRAKTERSSPPVVRDDVDPDKDPFVQEVVQVFGAHVQRVINAPATTSGGPPPQDPDDEPA